MAPVDQEIVGAQEGGCAGDHLRAHGLAVEACLERGEGGDAFGDTAGAGGEQLAVERAVEVERVEQVGEGLRDIVAAAGIEPPHPARGGGLHPDAVPFPFGDEVGGVEAGKRLRVERMGEHYRAERTGGGLDRLFGAAGQPVEERGVGRLETVPEFLDLGGLDAPEAGERLPGQPTGDADPQAAGDEFEQCVAVGCRQHVEPVGDEAGGLAARGSLQGFNDAAERQVAGAHRRRGGPDQRDGLGEVTHIVVGEREELRVHPFGDERAEHGGLEVGDVEIAGEGGERIAAIGVGGGGEVVGDEPELVVAARREGEAFEEGGEGVHHSGSSS